MSAKYPYRFSKISPKHVSAKFMLEHTLIDDISIVNISAQAKKRERFLRFKNGIIVGGHVLRLMIPLFAVILLFRFIYQGQNAQISFALIWEQLGSFDVGYDLIINAMRLISGMNLDFGSLPSVNNVSDFFDWVGALGGLIGDFFKGIGGLLLLPLGLIASAFEVVTFAINVLFMG